MDIALDEPENEPATIEEWVADRIPRLENGELGYAELVRDRMNRWRVSERTIKRRIAEARKALDTP